MTTYTDPPEVTAQAWTLPGVPDPIVATELVRAFCGWHVAPVISESFTLDTDGGPSLMLPTMRIVSVESVTLKDGTVLAPDTGFDWSARGFLVRTDGAPWPCALRGATIALHHGYDTPPPAVVSVAQALGRRAPALGLGRKTESTAAVSITYDVAAGALFGFEAQALSNYVYARGRL